MPLFSEAGLLWAAVVVQAAGLLSVMAARASAGCWGQRACQSLFFLSLLAVALITAVAIPTRNPCGISGAITFALMTVGATLDLRRSALDATI